MKNPTLHGSLSFALSRIVTTGALVGGLVGLGSLTACGDVETLPQAIDDETTSQGDVERFILWPNAQNYLIQNVRSGSTVRICLGGTGVNATTRPGFETTIREALITWVDGVRPTSTTALITGSEVIFSCTAANLNINWSASSGRANAGPGNINLFAGDNFAVVLHEFGHVFGLGDTYIEGVWSCSEGHENSVMCGSGGLFTALQRDDINAIQETFCMAFPGQCLRRWQADLGWCWHSTGRLHLGDFNGDGRQDMLCHDVSSGYKWTSLANSAGGFTGTSWQANLGWCSHETAQLHLGDFNGDSRSDMLCHDTSTGYKWIAYATAGGGFTGTNWEANLNWCSHAGAQLHVADFNGDGRSDMLCHDRNTGYKWIAYANASGAFGGTSWEANLGWCNHSSGRLHVGDYNGDGRTDMLCHDVSGGQKWIALAKAGGSFTGTSRVWSMGWCSHASAQFLTGDFDRNGVADFMCHDRSTGYKWLAYQAP